jgi:NADH-quinone oxidoreductase subunit J
MITFVLLAIVTAGSAIAVMLLRNLVHCALALAVTFLGLAAVYLQLEAQFVGFAQVLVYIGAVAILIVFAILLTRGTAPPEVSVFSGGWLAGAAVAVVVFLLLGSVVVCSSSVRRPVPPAPQTTVSQLGEVLMQKYVLPLEVIGLLLTAALIGAVLIAKTEKGVE